MRYISMILVFFLVGCGSVDTFLPVQGCSVVGSNISCPDGTLIPMPKDGATGPQGPQGEKGDPGVQGLQGIQGIVGPQGIQGSVGPQGIEGIIGPQGIAGVPGAPGTVVTFVKFCTQVTNYPSTFPEYGLCVGDSIFAVYSSQGGFGVEVPPGTYSSDGINSSCNFSVGTNCQIIN